MEEERKSKATTILGTLGVLANFGLARIARQSSVGRLVTALESDDEDTSTAAYMALVKLGPDYAGDVLRSCADVPPSPRIVQLLGDMGNKDLIPDLERWAASEDETIAATARESIEALEDSADCDDR